MNSTLGSVCFWQCFLFLSCTHCSLSKHICVNSSADTQEIKCPSALFQYVRWLFRRMFVERWILLCFISNCLCLSSFDATQCDLFHNERLCSLDSISDIVGTISRIENEAECQNRCTLDPACNHFMFIAFTSKDNKCFLLVKCTSDSKTCSDLEDCSNVITGPKTPALEEACCNDLQDVICENESEIDHSYDIINSTECINKG